MQLTQITREKQFRAPPKLAILYFHHHGGCVSFMQFKKPLLWNSSPDPVLTKINGKVTTDSSIYHVDLMQSIHQQIQTTHQCTPFRKSHKILLLAQNKTQQPSKQSPSSYLSFPKLAKKEHQVSFRKRRKVERQRSAQISWDGPQDCQCNGGSHLEQHPPERSCNNY